MNSCRLDLMGGQNLEKAYENCLSLAKKMVSVWCLKLLKKPVLAAMSSYR